MKLKICFTAAALFILGALCLTSCGFRSISTSEETEKRPDNKVHFKLEAEDAEIQGAKSAANISRYSGKGYIADFIKETGHVLFKVIIPSEGMYSVTIAATAVPGTGKSQSTIYVDGQLVGSLNVQDNGSFTECALPGKIKLTAGEHMISIARSGEGELMLDYISIDNSDSLKNIYVVEPKLITPEPQMNSKRLIKYLSDIYSHKIIAGQQAGSENSPEIQAIYKVTGKYPALRGFDFMDYSPSRVARGANSKDTDNAIKWWNDGGIVTFCWHWNAPKDLIDEAPDKLWWSGFYTKATTFDIEKAMNNPSSEDYKLILRDIDAIAAQLKRLQDEGVPVLWRPLHEASGGWFWWGAKGPEPYRKLWLLLYDRLTNYHKLNNLIWVWNGQSGDWYPGDNYVDIIGEDIYDGKHVYNSRSEKFYDAASYTSSKKIITMSENGSIPDPEQLVNDQIPWSWFCTWGGDFVVNKDGSYSEENTESSMLKKVYNSNYVITKDKLPDLKNYPLN